ncbi:MAG: hypothetical protein ABI333_20090 [bacterium]
MFGKREIVQVTLLVHGPATRVVKAGTYEVKAGTKLKALLKLAGYVGRGPDLTCLLEGERVSLSHRLNGGETVTALQMVAGG